MDKLIDTKTPLQHVINVCRRDPKGIGDLLGRCGAGFTDMVAANTDGVCSREVFRGILDGIPDKAYGGVDRKNPHPSANHFLQDVVLGCCAYYIRPITGFFGHNLVHGEHDACHRVYREAGADPVEGDVLEGLLKVPQRIHGHANASHVALGHGVVGVEPHLGGQVEGDVEARLPLTDQKLESFVCLPRCAEAGVLPHRVRGFSVHKFVNTPCEGIFARVAKIGLVVKVFQVFRPVDLLDWYAGFEDNLSDVFPVLYIGSYPHCAPLLLALSKPCLGVQGFSMLHVSGHGPFGHMCAFCFERSTGDQRDSLSENL
ncbi:MAG: hypothetical protein A4E63_01109 [Syntrophorhabdus sp. PtaU1.Bin050]|nr:MAG: hypothetical protein A4E63_01109 [Syntrophorhabdus sp. PtaU1.Bin050]